MNRCIRVLLLIAICQNPFSAYCNPVERQPKSEQRMVVVDAGSTGTRLHVYSYNLGPQDTPINIHEIWAKKLKPGLASLPSDRKTIYAYLNRLFSGAPGQNAPVYFYATGGMRLLPEPTQQIYYDVLQSWFSAHSGWRLEEAKTISGREEGIFAWLTINQRLGRLTSSNKPLVGVMDMGGASVQIVFPVQHTSDINKADLVDLKLKDRHVQVFAHSFLGLGQKVLSYQFLDSEDCFSKGYKLSSGSVAKGDAQACKRKISTLMNVSHGVDRRIKSALVNNPVASWYAIGGLRFLLESRPFRFFRLQITNQNLLHKADVGVCRSPWGKISKAYSEDPDLYTYCFLSSYYYALMVNGYGLDPKEPIHAFSDESSVDWTLGVVLYSRAAVVAQSVEQLIRNQ